MSYGDPNTDLFNEQPKPLSGTLKVLTVLTFIWCGIEYLSGIYNLYKSQSYSTDRIKMEQQIDRLGEDSFFGKALQNSLEMMDKIYPYRYVFFVSILVFTTFCLVGAIKMRKQKKVGLPLYIIGELSPIVITAILVGLDTLNTKITAFIALIFVILYISQRKNLIYN